MLRSTIIRVDHMCCGMEAKMIRDLLDPMETVAEVKISLTDKRVNVQHRDVLTPDELINLLNAKHLGASLVDRLAATVHCADAGGGDTFSIGNTTIWPSQSNNFKALEDADGFVIIGLDWRPGSVRTYAREGPGLAEERTLATWPGAKGPYCENDAYDGHPDAPFDAEFYFVINVAVGGSAGGGVAYWGEDVLWKGCDHPHMCDPRTDFADKEADWIETWTRPLEVDWIRVTKA